MGSGVYRGRLCPLGGDASVVTNMPISRAETISPILPEQIGGRIVWLRGEKVLLDADLAKLYGVSTARLNEQVKRNAARFPRDFAFRLTYHELRALMSQFAISNDGRGGTRKLPLAFTEHGALMAASVLNTARAIQTSVYVVRAFVRLREALVAHKELAKKLQDLERKTEELTTKHDALASSTRAQFKDVIEALRQLMIPSKSTRRPIGFVS
jgi:phage regulator Rha-like protein